MTWGSIRFVLISCCIPSNTCIYICVLCMLLIMLCLDLRGHVAQGVTLMEIRKNNPNSFRVWRPQRIAKLVHNY